MRNNRREVPPIARNKKKLHETVVFKSDNIKEATLTSYQCKKSKNVLILSSLHQDVPIPTSNNPKMKPETVLDYNKTKGAVDTYDQLLRLYSTKAGGRRWPMHVFYNIVDMALINSHIVFKNVLKNNISRKDFIRQLSEELIGHSKTTFEKEPKATAAVSELKNRVTCKTQKCKNRTTSACLKCNLPICGTCCVKVCKNCIA